MVVLGAPRSGTSLLAGLLVDAGFNVGDGLIPPSEHNPRGFFERLEVNAINDALLAPVVAARTVSGAEVPPPHLHWLAAVDGPVGGPAPAGLAERMRAAVPPAPYVVKDPRLSYTLPAWDGVLDAATVVCVVRDPGDVVASVLAMAEREPDYFSGWLPSPPHLFAFWVALHASVEAIARTRPVHWFHFDDLVHGDGAAQLGELLGVDVPGRRRERGLDRSRRRRLEVPDDVAALHDRLRVRCG